MSSPKISVIIPTYNRAHLISDTIRSVINQTYTDWELLVVDDGSTDDTKEIVEEFATNDQRIKYFYQEASGGPSSPRNLGIENAKGEYVAFLDSDDEWFPPKLEKQLGLFEKSNNKKLGVVYCFSYTKDSATKEILSQNNTFYQGNILKELVTHGGLISTTSCIMTKLSILKEVGLFDPNLVMYEDLDLLMRISASGYEFDCVQKYLLNYIVHKNNIFYNKNDKEKEEQFKIFICKNYKLHLKYNFVGFGYYFMKIKEYKIAREFFLKELRKTHGNNEAKKHLIGQIIITYYPKAEVMWKNIKKLFNK